MTHARARARGERDGLHWSRCSGRSRRIKRPSDCVAPTRLIISYRRSALSLHGLERPRGQDCTAMTGHDGHRDRARLARASQPLIWRRQPQRRHRFPDSHSLDNSALRPSSALESLPWACVELVPDWASIELSQDLLATVRCNIRTLKVSETPADGRPLIVLRVVWANCTRQLTPIIKVADLDKLVLGRSVRGDVASCQLKATLSTYARHDASLDVRHNLGPGLAQIRRLIRYERLQVARLHRRQHRPIADILHIIDYEINELVGGSSRWWQMNCAMCSRAWETKC